MDCQFVAYTDILQQTVRTYKQITRKWESNPVAARSKACVCRRSLAAIAGSNPAERHAYSYLVFVVCRVVRGLFYELITSLGDSY